MCHGHSKTMPFQIADWVSMQSLQTALIRAWLSQYIIITSTFEPVTTIPSSTSMEWHNCIWILKVRSMCVSHTHIIRGLKTLKLYPLRSRHLIYVATWDWSFYNMCVWLTHMNRIRLSDRYLHVSFNYSGVTPETVLLLDLWWTIFGLPPHVV